LGEQNTKEYLFSSESFRRAKMFLLFDTLVFSTELTGSKISFFPPLVCPLGVFVYSKYRILIFLSFDKSIILLILLYLTNS